MQVIPVSGLLLRRLHKLPAVKVLLVIVFLWLVAFEYCRLRYWRDPHSAFFDDSHVYEWKYSLYREHEGRHLISIHSAPIDPPQATKAGSNPLICAAFATVKRGTDDYFDASIGSLLEGLDPRERRALHLNVLFAGTDPTKHPSWGQKWVERLADSTGSYNVTESQFEHLRELEDVGNFYEKGIL